MVSYLHKLSLDSFFYILKYFIFFIIVDITLSTMNIAFIFIYLIPHFISISPVLWYTKQLLSLYSVIILSFQTLLPDVIKFITLINHNFSFLSSLSLPQLFTIFNSLSINKNMFLLSIVPILLSQNALETTAITINLFLFKMSKALSSQL